MPRKGLAAWAREAAPNDADLLARADVEALAAEINSPRSVVALGDTMLDGRTRKVLARHGTGYPFESVAPLLAAAPIVLANHEGPFAALAPMQARHYSYRVDPALATVVRNGGINVVTLANNHLFDCGQAGVLETIEAVDLVGLARIGIGRDRTEAHTPLIRELGPWRVGLLGYYWNSRCAATDQRPGGAMGTLEELREDIGQLRPLVDWVVVTFHWGETYERQPLEADRAKAHAAVDNGADLVVGHHPHVLQPYEVYRNRPIFYSLGNFAFGSGNSRAEGLLVRVAFLSDALHCRLVPLYVKNRDARVNYQPRILGGLAAERELVQLSELSASYGPPLLVRNGVGHLDVLLDAAGAPRKDLGFDNRRNSKPA